MFYINKLWNRLFPKNIKKEKINKSDYFSSNKSREKEFKEKKKIQNSNYYLRNREVIKKKKRKRYYLQKNLLPKEQLIFLLRKKIKNMLSFHSEMMTFNHQLLNKLYIIIREIIINKENRKKNINFLPQP